jgi:hypothetical protein
VLDANYFDFRHDILPKWSKPGAGKGESPSKAMTKQVTQNKFNATTSGMSKTMQSQGQETSKQNQTAGSRMHDSKSNAGGASQGSSATGRAVQAQVEVKIPIGKKPRGGLNNTAALLDAAHGDSGFSKPILFLVTHSVNVFETLTDYHMKRVSSLGGVRLVPLSLGEGLEEQVTSKLELSA